jgi:hypothetical protein
VGTNAVISVLGFIVVFSLITTTLNKRNTESYDNTYGYFKHTVARDIARNSIQVALRTIDTSNTIPSTFTISGAIDGGTYSVTGTKLSDSTLRLDAQGTFNDSVYRVRSTLLRKDTLFPKSVYRSALGIHPSPMTFSLQPSNGYIDGYDYYQNIDNSKTPPGGLVPGSSDSVAAIGVRTLADRNTVIAGTKDTVVNLRGNPKVMIDPNIPDPNTLGDLYQSQAKYTFYNTNPKKSYTLNGPYGDSLNPVIVYCDGRAGGRDTCTFALNGDGWGILIVRGQLELGSSKGWRGLVVVYGNAVINLNASGGGSYISGGALLGGAPGSGYNVTGNSNIVHSKAALDMAKKVYNPNIFQIVDWYE